MTRAGENWVPLDTVLLPMHGFIGLCSDYAAMRGQMKGQWLPNNHQAGLGRNTYFMACMADTRVVLFRVSRWGLVRDALK